MLNSFTKWQCCLLSALMSLAAVASCLYSSALPSMAMSVGKSVQALQFLVVANLLAHTVGPLFYGMFANRYGRLHAIRFGVALAAIGALGCGVTGVLGSYQGLLLSCFILTFGANVGLTLVLTMIKDRTSARQAQRFNALVLLSFAILPGLGVLLGSALLTYGAWWWIFGVIAAYCLLLFTQVSRLPETAPSMSVQTLAFGVLRSRRFWCSCLLLACVSGCFYTFNAQIPRIALNLLHLDVWRFGLFSNIPSLGMLVGNGLAIFLAMRYRPLANVQVGLWLALTAAALMLVYCLQREPSALGLFVLTGLLNVGLQIIFPAIATLALAPCDNSASAASFLAIINSGFAGILVACGNQWPSASYLSLPLSNIAIVLLAWLFYGGLRRAAA